MILSKFWVKGYGTFAKGAEFDLAYKGLTTVFGLNKDAGGASYTNASGKSLLFTSVPEIGFGSPPSGKDQTKHTNTEIGLEFRGGDKGRDVLTFVKTYGKGKKFVVCKNGKDLNVRKLGYAETKLQALLGGSEEDFYTTRYIDNTIPHPLIVGKAAVRQDFFVRMFNLENVDATRHLLLADLREAQKASATYKEVKALFDDLKGKALKPADIEERQERIGIYKARQEKLLAKLNTYQVVRDLLRFEDQNKKLIFKFNATTSLAIFDSEVFNTKNSIKGLRSKKELAQEWETYRRLRKVYLKAYEPLAAKIEELVGPSYKIDKVKAKAAKYLLIDAEYKTLRLAYTTRVVNKPKQVDEPKMSLEKANAKVFSLNEEFDHAKSFQGGKCPTCGAPHESRELGAIKSDMQRARETAYACQAYAEYKKDYDTYKKNKTLKAELEAQLEDAIGRLEAIQNYAEAYELIKQLPKKPVKPEGDKLDLSDIEEKLDKWMEKKSELDRFKDVIEQIRELSKVTEEQRAKAKELDTITDDLGKISNKLNNLTAEVTAGIEASKQLKQLATRGKVLEKQAEDEPVLKSLIDAYSKKGLKKILIQRYASLLQQQVNKFVRLFFAEDIQFEFSYGSKLDVLAHRKKGKKVITTDVKRLSGAEKRMLTLVLVVASISLLPKNKRSNFLILDEPEANMGPEAVATFVRALPVLNKVIPHIVVITPRPELEIEGSRVFTVVKKGGVSTLVPGKAGAK